MKYIIIGLGNYGHTLVEELTAMGHEVIGVDTDPNIVDVMKDKMTASYVMDATDEQALLSLPLNAVDIVIVAVGENFGASVYIVALLKKYKVKHIYARAVDATHRGILEAFEIDRILLPEQVAARILAHSMELDVSVTQFNIDDIHYIFKFDVPKTLVGTRVHLWGVEEKHQLKLISIVRGRQMFNNLGMSIKHYETLNDYPEDFELEEGDKIVCFAAYTHFVRFWKSIKE